MCTEPITMRMQIADVLKKGVIPLGQNLSICYNRTYDHHEGLRSISWGPSPEAGVKIHCKWLLLWRTWHDHIFHGDSLISTCAM